MSRERMPPRGPKGMYEAPLGPRANFSTEFRGSSRGRGRGRGFRDESRDRGRDVDRDRGFGRDYSHRDERPARFRDDRSRERDADRDRDYRNVGSDRRDSRGRGGHSYRGERSREREWRDRDGFHNRNASPQLRRSRSPDLRSSRDARDGHLNLDLDRTHRGSRDGPLSAGSSSSDPSALASSSHFNRGGYGRGRGLARGDWDPRGGGRPRYPEDRYRARSRSQERDIRDIGRGRGDMRDDRGRRDERGPEISRTLNDRRASNWGSPNHSGSGPSPSSNHDDSRREEGEINREPRTDIVARRNPDLGPNRREVPNDLPRPRPRAATQSPPSEVPAFGSVTGRSGPPPSAPSASAQGSAAGKAPPAPSPAHVSNPSPTMERPTPTISTTPVSAAHGSITDRASPVTSATTASSYGLMTGRTPPIGPKADRGKPVVESPIPSSKDARPPPRAGSNVTLSPSTPKESQGAKNLSNLDGVQIRGTSMQNSRPTASQYYNPKPSDRPPPTLQAFAGQKHARSDSEQDVLYGLPAQPSMPAPSIPTEPRADRVKNISSPSKTSKTRYTPALQAPNTDASMWPKARDPRNADLGQNQGNLTGNTNKTPGYSSKPAIQSTKSDVIESEPRISQDQQKSLQQQLIELKARSKIKPYVPVYKESKIGDESSHHAQDSFPHDLTDKSSKPLVINRPLEIDSKISFDDNASDSDSGDEDELDEEYFEAQNRKLTMELAEVESITKPQEQLFPPCDLTIDDLAFAEIHDVDIAIISDLSSKQSSLAPVTKGSPLPTADPNPMSQVAVQDLVPKSETTETLMSLSEPPLTMDPVTLPDVAPTAVAAENKTPQPELPISDQVGRRTPSPSRLIIIPDTIPFHEDSEFLKSFDIPKRRKEGMKDKMRKAKHFEKEIIKKEQAEYIKNYKLYLQIVADLDAEKPRKPIHKADLSAAKDARRAPAAILSIEVRPEGGRSTRNSHQSQLELEAVLRASEQEAQDLQKKFDNKAQSKPNYAVEAEIPDQFALQKREQTRYVDKTGLVPFNDAIDVFGFGEFRTDFTPEERKIFEKAYKKTPKQWGIIAESLENRDFHDCIAHYYAVKGDASWPFKVRKVKATKTRAGNKPRSKTIMADTRDLELDDQNDKHGRRVTRAAAAGSENVPSESEATTTPVPASGKRAPTPMKTAPVLVKGRALTPAPPKKGLGISKLDPNLAANPPEKKPRKSSARATGTKKKNNQIAISAQGLSPQGGIEDVANKNDARGPRGSVFGQGYDGQTDPNANSFPEFMSREQPVAAADLPMNINTQSYGPHDNSMGIVQQPPSSDSQHHDRRGLQSTSSYWSVPEQNDFPGLIKAYGTDWGRIANHMTSKTHIMVFTTKTQQRPKVPLHIEESIMIANIQTQVKNYYQRQVESKPELERLAIEADAKKAQGKPLDLPPPSGVPSKRPYNSSASQQASAHGSETFDDLPPKVQSNTMQQAPSSQPSLSSRFPALAQAGPVPQTSSEASHVSSMSQKHAQFARPAQQIQQNVQARPFTARGPALGYFSDRERPILSASATTQAQSFAPLQERSVVAAQAAREAENEMKQAVRLEKEQKERIAREHDRQQHLQEQERSRMKQETSNDHRELRQFDAYSVFPQQPTRIDSRISSPVSDTRHGQPFGSRSHHVRIMSETAPSSPHIPHSSPAPVATRPLLDIKTNVPQQYSSPATPVQPPIAPQRPPEPVRNVSIMSLLNDEPSDPRPVPAPKRVNEVASSAIPRSHSPNLQQPTYQPSRIQTSQSSLRREPPLNDLQNAQQSYGSHTPAPSQGSMRLVESPYSAATQSRSQMASPMDSSPASERDYFRQKQYTLPPQQLSGSTSQSGPSFQTQQANQTNHRLLAFGPQSQRTASPPNTQYSSQSHLSTSRHSSFDSRQGPPPSSIAQQQGFGTSHQHQGSPMPVHHQHAHQHPLQNSRFGGQQPIASQMQQLSHSRPPSQQHHYSQSSPHSMQQPVQSGAPMRSFTPLSYESRPYAISSPGPALQQQQQVGHEQQSMLRRPLQQAQQQQQEAAGMRQEQQRQHDGGYDNGYNRRGLDGYEQQLYEDRRDERRNEDPRR